MLCNIKQGSLGNSGAAHKVQYLMQSSTEAPPCAGITSARNLTVGMHTWDTL